MLSQWLILWWIPFSFSVTAVASVMKIPITSHSLVHSGSVVLVRESRSHQKTGRLYVDSAAEGEGTISTIAKTFRIMAGVADQDRDFGSAFDSDGNTSKRERREFFLAAQ